MFRIALILGISCLLLGACSDDDDPPPGNKDTGVKKEAGTDKGPAKEAGTDKGPAKEAGTDGKVADDKGPAKEAGTDGKATPDGVVTMDKGPMKEAGGDAMTTDAKTKLDGNLIGAIVITEIMANPGTTANPVDDDFGEYFEIYNTSSATVDLAGWTIKDAGSDSHVIAASGGTTTIAAGTYMVLGRSKDTTKNGNVKVDYLYSKFILANTADEIILLDKNSKEVDKVYYDTKSGWTITAGASISADPAKDNSQPKNWCTEKAKWTGSVGDKGTPGAKAGCP